MFATPPDIENLAEGALLPFVIYATGWRPTDFASAVGTMAGSFVKMFFFLWLLYRAAILLARR
jgi:hypothetical protein